MRKFKSVIRPLISCFFLPPSPTSSRAGYRPERSDAHETIQGLNGHLLGGWVESEPTGRARVDFDFHYITDSLWNIESPQKARLASWNRGRGTVDIDFGELAVGMACLFMQLRSGREAAILAPILVSGQARVGCRARTAFALTHGVRKAVVPHRLDSRIGQIAGQDFLGLSNMEPHSSSSP